MQPEDFDVQTAGQPGRAMAFAALLALLGGFAPLSLPAALPSSPPAADAAEESTFFESVDVRVINVEVVVTDGKGRPVTGLTREDFELLEDGKPVPITHFYAPPSAAEAPAAPVPESSAPPAAPAAPAAPAEAQPIPEGQRLQIAVFVDATSLPPFARQQLAKSLREFFRSRVDPDARILLAGYDDSLRLHSIRQGDTAALDAAIQEEMSRPVRHTETELERRRVLREIEQASLPPLDERPDSSDLEAGAVQDAVRLYAQNQDDRNRRTLRALKSVIDAISGLPGRRALLWVGGGMSMRPAEMLIEAFRLKYASTRYQDFLTQVEAYEHDATGAVRDAAAYANAHRVTIYGIGLSDGSLGISAENPAADPALRDLGRGEEFARNEAVELVAGDTGGLAGADTADPGAFLNRMRADLSTAYSLGYSPDRRAATKLHSLQVRTRDRHLKVRHRAASRDQTTDERMRESTSTALLLDAADNPLDAALEFEAERPHEKGTVLVSMLVKVPMARLVLLPQENVHEGALRIYVGARDADGRLSDITIVTAPVRVPNENLLTALGQIVGCRVSLVLRPGEHRIVAGIWDDVGKSESVVLAKYSAGDAKKARTASAPAAPSER